jgi:hypothetical protein
VTNPIDNADRTDDHDGLFATHMDPQQRVEADEMIDMHVADEDVPDAKQVARTQG